MKSIDVLGSPAAITRARPSERGTALASFTALFDLGIVVGGPLLGLVLQLTNYTTMFATAGALAFAGLVVFVLWDR